MQWLPYRRLRGVRSVVGDSEMEHNSSTNRFRIRALANETSAKPPSEEYIWLIKISPPGRIVDLTTGERSDLFGDTNTLYCVAVAPAGSRNLALVFDSRQGITDPRGRRPVSRLISVSRHGGEVTVKRYRNQFKIKVSVWPTGGTCCLCGMQIEQIMPLWCKNCGLCFHGECLKDQAKCPICRKKIKAESE